jgi:S1-C subfamily serine protease
MHPSDSYAASCQTSAVNPGFGGGPLFDLQGRAVGITSLNLGQVGRFSLAIPIHLFHVQRESEVVMIQVASADRSEFYR